MLPWPKVQTLSCSFVNAGIQSIYIQPKHNSFMHNQSKYNQSSAAYLTACDETKWSLTIRIFQGMPRRCVMTTRVGSGSSCRCVLTRRGTSRVVSCRTTYWSSHASPSRAQRNATTMSSINWFLLHRSVDEVDCAWHGWFCNLICSA